VSLPQVARTRIYLMLLSPEYTATREPNYKYTEAWANGLMLDVQVPAVEESGRVMVENTRIVHHQFHPAILRVSKRIHNEALSALKEHCCWVQVVICNENFVNDLIRRGFPLPVSGKFISLKKRLPLRITAVWKDKEEVHEPQKGTMFYLSQFCLTSFVRALWTASDLQNLQLRLATHITVDDVGLERTLLAPFLQIRGLKSITVGSLEKTIRHQLEAKCVTAYASAAEIEERAQELKYQGDRFCAAMDVETGANLFEEALVFLHDCKMLYPAIFKANLESNGHILYRDDSRRKSAAKSTGGGKESQDPTASQRKRAAKLRQSIRNVFAVSQPSSEHGSPVTGSPPKTPAPNSSFRSSFGFETPKRKLSLPQTPALNSSFGSSFSASEMPSRNPPPPPPADLHLTAAKLSLCFARAKNAVGDYNAALRSAKNALFLYEIPDIVRNGLIAQLVLAHKKLYGDPGSMYLTGTEEGDHQDQEAAADAEGLYNFKRWLAIQQASHPSPGVAKVLQEVEEAYLWG
jgi:hypothetical protein